MHGQAIFPRRPIRNCAFLVLADLLLTLGIRTPDGGSCNDHPSDHDNSATVSAIVPFRHPDQDSVFFFDACHLIPDIQAPGIYSTGVVANYT